MNPLTRSPARPSIASVRPGRHRTAHRDAAGASALVTWVLPESVAIVTPPQEGEPITDWLRSLRHQGISVLVSLDRAVSLDSTSLERCPMHPIRCQLRADVIPPLDRTMTLCAGVLRLLRQGDRVAIHCDALLGRSALFAGALLLWTGHPLEEALELTQRLGHGDMSPAKRAAFLREFQGAVAGAELTGAVGPRRLVG